MNKPKILKRIKYKFNTVISMKNKKCNYLIVAAVVLLFVGCKPCDNPFYCPLEQSENFIADYFMKDTEDQQVVDSAKVFIDFSDGMSYAYTSNPENAKMLEAITHKLIAPNITWYGLGGAKVYPLDFPSTQLYNKVTDTKSYSKEIMAPIEKTLSEIVEGHSETLLITDFEEYTSDKKEQFENFAKEYFKKWLDKGNSINFFITSYVEKTKDKRNISKHLYFAVFSTANNKLLTDIQYAFKDRGFNYTHFSLTTKFYTISNKYPSEKKGGIYYDEKGNDIVCVMDENKYINGMKSDKSYEYYPFTESWENIIKNSQSLMEEGVPKPFTALFRNLHIDVSNEDVYQLKKMKIKVSDVTEDFEFYTKTQEALKHKPKLSRDAKGNSIFDPEEKDPIALECYNQEGKLLSQWIYAPKEIKTMNEIFALDEEIYHNALKNSNQKEIEIAIKYDDNLDISILKDFCGLLRIDVVIADCEPNLSNLENLFSWESVTSRGRTNSSLSEAIRNTLDRVNPKEKVVYSYFVQIVK